MGLGRLSFVRERNTGWLSLRNERKILLLSLRKIIKKKKKRSQSAAVTMAACGRFARADEIDSQTSCKPTSNRRYFHNFEPTKELTELQSYILGTI